jgi:hypothetical protein
MAKPDRSRRNDSLRRKAERRAELRTFVLCCEGRLTEPSYFEALRRVVEIRTRSHISIDDRALGSVPLTLVDRALEIRRENDRSGIEVDEYWCVFDVEQPRHHPNLDVAISRARANGIKVAISNPCFELWLILHFQRQSAGLDNRECESLRRRLDMSRGKELNAALYLPLRATAVANARWVTNKHSGDGTAFPDDNPSSTVYELMEALEPPG